MFAVIRHYHFDSKKGAEIDRQSREGFVPLLEKAKGFVRYYWLDTGKGEGASVSVFRDKAGADESVRLAADYVQTHLSKLRIQKPEIIEGPIKAHDCAPTISAKPVARWSVSQLWTRAAEQTLLLTRIAAMGSVSLCAPMNCCLCL